MPNGIQLSVDTEFIHYKWNKESVFICLDHKVKRINRGELCVGGQILAGGEK